MTHASTWPQRDDNLWTQAQVLVVAAWLNRSDTDEEIIALSEWLKRESAGDADIITS